MPGKAAIFGLALFGAASVDANCALLAGRTDIKASQNLWCYETPRTVTGGCTAYYTNAVNNGRFRLCSDPGSGTFCTNGGTWFTCAAGDPHFTTSHGDSFDFKGKNNTAYNMLSHTRVSVNALFNNVDFNMAGPRRKLVHGSYMQEVYMTMRTTHNDEEMRVFYAAARAQAARVTVAGVEHPLRQGGEFVHDGVKITLADRVLTVNTSDWIVSASSKINPQVKASQPRAYLTIGVHPTFDADHATVSPHGLLGQHYDGDFAIVEGKKDNYDPMVVTTEAMGEGAIEGAAADYEIKGDKFGTSFMFSRYGVTTAVKPRDATKLRRKAERADAKARAESTQAA